MSKLLSILCCFLYFFSISGDWNCRAANSFSTTSSGRPIYKRGRIIAQNPYHPDGQDERYSVSPLRTKQNDNLPFNRGENSMGIGRIVKYLKSEKNNEIGRSQTSFQRDIKLMSTSNQLRGGNTVTFAPTVKKDISSPNANKASIFTRYNANAFISAIAVGGFALMLIELYSNSSTSVISQGPFKLLLSSLLSVKFWAALAPFASLSMKLSPMSTVLKFRKKQDVGGLPLLPYSAMFTLTFVLTVYGFLIGDSKIMFTHGTGNLISIFYCSSYLKNCPSTATHLPGPPNLHKLVSGSILSATCLLVWLRGKSAANLAGMSSVILSSVMYVGPLTVLRSAIQKRSARDIPLPFAIMAFINSFAWMAYGIFEINDWMIYTPCIIGFVSSSTQIFLNILYHEKDEEQLKRA